MPLHPEKSAQRVAARSALAAWLGSALEFYDFFIFGTAAALVFGKVFFPAMDPSLHGVATLAAFGVAYIARPVGAVLWGHIGDTIGRKAVLSLTLMLMGGSTFLIGLLPGYDQIGVAAPTLLVLLRLLQGLAVSGEHAAANTMALEQAPAHRRAFFSSFTISGTSAGVILAAIAFLPVAAMPEADRLAWGWRVPFLLSALVVLFGLWVRLALPESPDFVRQRPARRNTPLPVIALFSRHGRDMLRVVVAALISVVSTVSTIFALAHAVNDRGLSGSMMLALSLTSSAVMLVTVPGWAWLGDRIGRKPVFIGGALASGLAIWPFMWAISRADAVGVFVAGVVLMGLCYSAANAIWPAFFGEMFDTRVRMSGTAIGTQIGFALAGFAPSLCASLIGQDGEGWMSVALLVSTATVLSAVAATTARETHAILTDELGRKPV